MRASWRQCTAKGRLLKKREKTTSGTQALTLRHIAIDFFSICVFLTHCPAVRCCVLFTLLAFKIFPFLFTFWLFIRMILQPFWPSRSEMSNFLQSMFHVWIVVGYLGSSIPSGFVHLGVWWTGFILSEKSHEVDSVFVQRLSVIYFPSFKSQVAFTVNVSRIGKLIHWSAFRYSMAGTSLYLYRK